MLISSLHAGHRPDSDVGDDRVGGDVDDRHPVVGIADNVEPGAVGAESSSEGIAVTGMWVVTVLVAVSIPDTVLLVSLTKKARAPRGRRRRWPDTDPHRDSCDDPKHHDPFRSIAMATLSRLTRLQVYRRTWLSMRNVEGIWRVNAEVDHLLMCLCRSAAAQL